MNDATRNEDAREPEDQLEGLDLEGLLAAGLSSLESPAAGRFNAPAPEELQDLFADYELVRLLGQGGMGAVYLAQQRELARPVALKVLSPELHADAAFAERFRREAQSLASLRHPHVVGVYDFGEAGPYLYLAMELVEGENLRQLLRAGPLAGSRVASIALQVCDALDAVHRQGIVHRDLKPANVLIGADGAAYLADFGLAKRVEDAAPSVSPSLTGTREAFGTPNYMAPEQQEPGADVDARADLYALGVLCYELLTGKLPLGRFDPPSQRRDGVAQAWDPVVLRLLEADPARRFQSAADLRPHLDSLTKERPMSTPTTKSKPKRAPRVVKSHQFIGVGCLVQGLGLLTPFVAGSIRPGAVGLGLLIGLGLLVWGGRLALRWTCSECGHRVPDRKVRLCQACGARFD